MKLSHVLLLIIFSGILSFGVVIDISFAASDIQREGPYESYALGYRFGGIEERLHVYMYARASSTDRARNGTLDIGFQLNSGWSSPPYQTPSPVNRHHWLWDTKTFQFEESGGLVWASASGYSTGGVAGPFFQTYASVNVDPMPPPTPQEGTTTEPEVGISATDSDDTASTGETHEYTLITETPYYWVGWYVKAPWETGDLGTFITSEDGDGTKTESTFSYSFPSGSMHTGNFLITAVIYRWSDMSEYKETYTETVSLE